MDHVAAVLTALPPPASGSMEEISFRRLLQKCAEISAGDHKGKAELQRWRTSVLFHHYVETLSEQVADLEKAGKVDFQVIQKYREAVTSFEKQLQPPNSARPTAQPDAAAGERAARSALFSRLQNSGAAAQQPAGGGEQLSEAARRNLQTQDQLQDMLTDEMVGMAAGLKGNSLAMESQLRQRTSMLDDTDAALQHSLHHARKSKAKAKQIYGRNRIGFCKTCLALLFVGCAFVGMYMFIRVTYFVGFKH